MITNCREFIDANLLLGWWIGLGCGVVLAAGIVGLALWWRDRRELDERFW